MTQLPKDHIMSTLSSSDPRPSPRVPDPDMILDDSPLYGVQVLVFDLMGTCTDWHTSIVAAMLRQAPPPPLTDADLPVLAMAWRTGFFRAIFASYTAGEQAPSIDEVHARVLDAILAERGVGTEVWNASVREQLVHAWHDQQAWPDSVEGIRRLKERCMVVVLANGTTRLQLDIVRAARLPFDTLFSSQILHLTKPDPAAYATALALVGVRPEQAAMVAAHAYDLRAAAKAGMRTVYIRRATEDPDEDMDAVRSEVDVFIDGAGGRGGLLALSELMGC